MGGQLSYAIRVHQDGNPMELAQTETQFQLFFDLIEKIVDHFFPPKQEMEAKIVTNTIRCIEANSSASKRTGKFKSMHSGDKSESGAQYMCQTYTGLYELLPMIKSETDGDILSQLASYVDKPATQMLSEV